MDISSDMTALAAKIVNASEVIKLGRAVMNVDPYQQPLPERIRRKYVEEKKTSSNTSTDRT